MFEKEFVFLVVMLWLMFSLAVSSGQTMKGNCDKTYPINYVFYSKLFCEVK